MKSILKNLLKNRTTILIIINLAVIFWITWFERNLQYEPLLDFNSNMEDRRLPLVPQVYDVIIIAIIVNIMILFYELIKIRNCKFIKCNLISSIIYFIFIIFCVALGYYHIHIKSHNLVIYEGNTLFRFPIWLFGKKQFTSIVTVTNLYVSLSVILICVCIINICIKKGKSVLNNRLQEHRKFGDGSD